MRRALALAIGLTLVFAACGTKASPKATVLAASTKTVGGTTARMALDIKISGKQGTPTEITGTGVTDLTKHTGLLDLKLPAFGGQNLGTIQARLVQSVIYEKLPDTLASAAGIKGWVKIDLQALAKANGFDVSSLTQGQSSDPSQFLDLLKTVSDDVKDVGKEKVRDGVEATRYTATVDLGKALADNSQLDATAKAKLGDLYKNLTAPANIWVDGQGRLRKMTYTLDPSKFNAAALASNPKIAASLSQIAGIDFTLELYSFGVPVSVTAPPANETTDLSTLTGGLGLG